MSASSFVRKITDGLANALTGAGTTADKRTHAFYTASYLSPQQIDAAYRSSWLVRKIVDRPANDMVRAWRDWQVEGDQIAAIEAEEKRLALRDKVRRALILGRLGGGALILGVPQGDPALPLNLRGIGKGALRYVHVVSRFQLSLGEIVTDPENELFGRPAYFELTSGRTGQARLHPSRVIAFKGLPVPDIGVAQQADWFWGDSIVQAIDDAVKNADAAQGGIASLIEEAKVDVFRMKGLMELVASAEGEARVGTRLDIMQAAKSIHRAVILDAEDEWDQRQLTWTGMPDIIRTFLSIVAGAADIPATILLGKSPDGMNATGDADFRAYYDSIGSKQENDLRPLIERIDEVMVPSALGSTPTDATFTWAPLWQMDEVQAATVMKTKAEAVKIYSDSQLIPHEALAEAVGNMLTEDGSLPGLDAALDAMPDMGEGADPLVAANENTVAALQQVGTITKDQARALLRDAQPRTLYVQRKLLNAADVIAWAKGQGFDTTLPAAEMHVTIAYSRTAVDWMKVGSTWDGDAKGQLEVKPGGARIVEKLGDKGAVVLLFGSSELSWRHEDIKRAGASFDFDEYQPHVAITYAAAEGLDLSKVEPYRGRLLFGPEIFEELNPDWAESVTEA